MNFESGNLYHVFNQGNNQQQVFINPEDYLYFLHLIRKNVLPISEILAYCLMPNHFHLMLYTDSRCATKIKQGGLFIDPITNSFRKILSGYTRVLNDKYGGSGSIFRQKTKAKCLSDMLKNTRSILHTGDYYFNCFHYIHQNPLKAGLVENLVDWPFSSYLDYAGLRKGTLCNQQMAADYCGYQPKEFRQICHDLERFKEGAQSDGLRLTA